MITGIRKKKHWEKIYNANVNVSLIVKNVTRIESGITISVGVSVKIQKNIVCAKKKKKTIWNPATCSCKNGKHVWRMVHDSVITCDEIIKETKTIPTKTVLTKCTWTKSNSPKTVPTKRT